jgi:hypothetical protein
MPEAGEVTVPTVITVVEAGVDYLTGVTVVQEASLKLKLCLRISLRSKARQMLK